jgi:hypothetical protein
MRAERTLVQRGDMPLECDAFGESVLDELNGDDNQAVTYVE